MGTRDKEIHSDGFINSSSIINGFWYVPRQQYIYQPLKVLLPKLELDLARRSVLGCVPDLFSRRIGPAKIDAYFLCVDIFQALSRQIRLINETSL